MRLFDRIKKIFIHDKQELQQEDFEEEIPQEEYASQYQGKSDEIAAQAMDILLLEEEEEDSQPNPIIISEYDAGDVGFDELENEELIDNSIKNVIVHESLDELEDPLEGVDIIGDISTEVSFDLD